MKTTLTLYAILALALLTVIGCGRFDAPTASQPTETEEMAMWNPQPGDQMGGHEIPRVEPGYWESAHGAAVNPWTMPSRTVTISPLGGIIVYGPHMLIVPAGAVDEPMNITLSNASATGIALDCGPSPFTFNEPLTLIMSYRGTQYSQTDGLMDPSHLQVYYLAPDGHLEAQRCALNTGLMTVSAQINHFSRYILGSTASSY